jgi:hypothetical protein
MARSALRRASRLASAVCQRRLLSRLSSPLLRMSRAQFADQRLLLRRERADPGSRCASGHALCALAHPLFARRRRSSPRRIRGCSSSCGRSAPRSAPGSRRPSMARLPAPRGARCHGPERQRLTDVRMAARSALRPARACRHRRCAARRQYAGKLGRAVPVDQTRHRRLDDCALRGIHRQVVIQPPGNQAVELVVAHLHEAASGRHEGNCNGEHQDSGTADCGHRACGDDGE